MGCCFSTSYPTLDQVKNLEPHGKYKARLVKVYDGDTQTYVIKFKSDFHKIQVRLAGINTPEVNPKDPNYQAGINARNRAFELLTGHKMSNPSLQELTNYLNKHEVYVTLECLKTEKYGRTLAHVITRDGYNLVEKLIQEKHGIKYF